MNATLRNSESPQEEAMAIRGSCLCGVVSYEITAFATWGIINPDQFRWTSGVEFVEGYKSSPGRERCFCKKCGSPLVSTHSGKVTEVVLGTVDGDPGARPGEHIFVGSKAPWYEIVDALPQFEGWPPGMKP